MMRMCAWSLSSSSLLSTIYIFVIHSNIIVNKHVHCISVSIIIDNQSSNINFYIMNGIVVVVLFIIIVVVVVIVTIVIIIVLSTATAEQCLVS